MKRQREKRTEKSWEQDPNASENKTQGNRHTFGILCLLKKLVTLLKKQGDLLGIHRRDDDNQLADVVEACEATKRWRLSDVVGGES
jgi:sulfite reductase alpha subunit-like flavoprotein